MFLYHISLSVQEVERLSMFPKLPPSITNTTPLQTLVQTSSKKDILFLQPRLMSKTKNLKNLETCQQQRNKVFRS